MDEEKMVAVQAIKNFVQNRLKSKNNFTVNLGCTPKSTPK